MTERLVLTDEQQEAIDYVLAVFDDDNYAHIQGAAGTGKTTLVLDLMENNSFDRCYLTAPTNKAAKVLRDKTGKEAITIHKMLKMVLEDVEDKQLLSIAGTPNFDPDESILMIVDEASMLSLELMEIIHETVANNDDICVLYVGDPFQLNPIGESLSTAFDCEGFKITKVLRQAADNPVIQLAHELVRKQIVNETRKLKFRDYVNNTHIFGYHNINDFIDNYITEYKQGIKTHILAWRNVRVAELNDAIRMILHGEVSLTQPFLVGEEVMFYEPLIAFRKDRNNRSRRVTLVENSALAAITSVEQSFRVFNGEEVHYWILGVVDDLGTEHEIKYPMHTNQVDRMLAAIAKEAKQLEGQKRKDMFSKQFFPLKNLFTKIKVSHAMTSHKSQGSTFESVYVDVQDINRNWDNMEKLRSLYVAVTRCSRRLNFYGR